MYELYDFIWIFFLYAFIGWCTEVAFAALKEGVFVNRGFLNGPVCPIYGFGVLIIVACLTPLKDNALVLFVGSVLLTSLLEWVTGFVLEKLFHQRWWDYSDEPFNLGGYICLRFSLAWGFACLIVMDIVHPSIMALIGWVPRTLGVVLLCLFGAVMAVDLIATVKAIIKMNDHLRQIDELAAKIKEASNDFGESLAGRVLDISEKGGEWKNAITEKTEDMKESLDDLKDAFTEKREDVKESLDDWKDSLTERKEDMKESLDELRRRLETLLSSRDRGERRLLRAFPKVSSERYREAMEQWKRRQGER